MNERRKVQEFLQSLLEERFESQVLPLFARRTREVNKLIPQLYLHGLAQGDFDLALRGFGGRGTHLSQNSGQAQGACPL